MFCQRKKKEVISLYFWFWDLPISWVAPYVTIFCPFDPKIVSKEIEILDTNFDFLCKKSHGLTEGLDPILRCLNPLS